MGAGGDGPGGQDFKDFQAESEQKYGTKFAKSMSDLPPPDQPRLALISGRPDNPKLLRMHANGSSGVPRKARRPDGQGTEQTSRSRSC
jgi:hypothetical protein